jgi:hypothetical protein
MSGAIWEPKRGYEPQEPEVAGPYDLSDTAYEPNHVYDAEGRPEDQRGDSVQQSLATVHSALGAARKRQANAPPELGRLIAAVEELLEALETAGWLGQRDTGPEPQE